MSNNAIPDWLNPIKEIKQDLQPAEFVELSKEEKTVAFILSSYKVLNLLKLKPKQINSITSNSISEVGFKFEFKGFNLGGWKTNEKFCKDYKKKYGVDPKWFQKDGHINSGDDETVYYRVFDNFQHFYKEWCERFVPQNAEQEHRYYKTGKEFWKYDSNWKPETWFAELCAAEYKGPITKANPTNSINSFKSLNSKIAKMFCQHMLEIEVDGDWGNGSKTAAQKINGTGNFDLDLFEKLFHTWEKQEMKVIVEL